MIVSTEGLVIHQIKYGETSSIVQVFTRLQGMVKVMVNGVRGKKSKAGLLQPLNQIELVYYRKDHQQIYNIKEIRMTKAYQHLNTEPDRIAQLMFCTELIHKTVKEEEQNDALYDFIQTALDEYDAQFSSNADFHLSFLAGLAAFVGIQPMLNYNQENKFFSLTEASFQGFEDLQCLTTLQSQTFFKLFNGDKLSLSNAERRALLLSVLAYYQAQFPHMGKIRSVEVLQQVFRVA
ncbi:MAG: DNA repair protein RecO [Flavobacteriales bacterium]